MPCWACVLGSLADVAADVPRREGNPEKEERYLCVVVVRLATLVTMTARSWSRTAYITL